MVRTLLERSKSLVTDSEDKEKEDTHVEEILRTCGYPEWSIRKVKRQLNLKTVQKKKAKQQHTSVKRPLVVIPYVEHISETVARTVRKYDIHVAMRPGKTLMVHPKDKPDKEDITECVYKVPCANCDKTYVGETGRKFGVRLQEHRTECESKTKWARRSHHTVSLAEINKYGLTNHANQENYKINWSKATVTDKEPDRLTRLIKEATHIHKEGAQSMDHDEGSYQLSHAYDRFLGTSSSSSRHAKNRKN